MKNKQIIDSWNKIVPDGAADERMLRAILGSNRSAKTSKGGISAVDRSLNWKWLVPIAACLVLALVIAGPFLNRGGSDLQLERSSGVRVSYVGKLPGKIGLASLADLMWLTEDELFATHVLGYEIAVFEGTVEEVRNVPVISDRTVRHCRHPGRQVSRARWKWE